MSNHDDAWKADNSITSVTHGTFIPRPGTTSSEPIPADQLPENAVPTAANNTKSIPSDQPYAFQLSDFGYSDPEGDPMQILRIDSPPNRGVIIANNAVQVGANYLITRDIIESGNLKYIPPAGQGGVNFTSFQFSVSDSATFLPHRFSSRSLFTFDVVLENFPPTSQSFTVTLDEDTPTAITPAMIPYVDINADPLTALKVVEPPASGVLTLSGTPVLPLEYVTAADLQAGNLVFTPATNAVGAPYTTVPFQVYDGTVYSVATYTITFNVIAVNDPPTSADGTITTVQGPNEVYTISVSDFAYQDTEGAPMAAIQVTQVPSMGFLIHDGDDTEVGTIIPVADINAGLLEFEPRASDSGVPYTTFKFKVFDGVQWSISDYTMTVNVTPNNLIPAIDALDGDSWAYTIGQEEFIDRAEAATIIDPDSANLDTGTLTVTFTSGAVSGEDELKVATAGNVSTSGSNVLVSAVTVGTWAGGTNNTPLVITFNSNATPALATEVLRAITYENTDGVSPTLGTRTMTIIVTDGDGGTSQTATVSVVVAGASTDLIKLTAPGMVHAVGERAFEMQNILDENQDGTQNLDAASSWRTTSSINDLCWFTIDLGEIRDVHSLWISPTSTDVHDYNLDIRLSNSLDAASQKADSAILETGYVDTRNDGGVRMLKEVVFSQVRTARYVTVEERTRNNFRVFGCEIYGVGASTGDPVIPAPDATVVWWDEAETSTVNTHPRVNLNGPDCEQNLVSSNSGHGCITFSGPGVYGSNTTALINHGPPQARHGLKCVYACVDKTADVNQNTSRCPTLAPNQNYWNYRAEMKPKNRLLDSPLGTDRIEQMDLGGLAQSGGAWYGLSVWLPTTSPLGPIGTDVGVIITQWHGQGGNPPIAFRPIDSINGFRLAIKGGPRANVSTTTVDLPNTMVRGEWIDLIFNFKWDWIAGNNPYTKVWVYREGVARGVNDHANPHFQRDHVNMYDDGAQVPYWKYGIYMSSWQNYPIHKNTGQPYDPDPGKEILEVWYDSIRAALSSDSATGFAAVDPANYDTA